MNRRSKYRISQSRSVSPVELPSADVVSASVRELKADRILSVADNRLRRVLTAASGIPIGVVAGDGAGVLA